MRTINFLVICVRCMSILCFSSLNMSWTGMRGKNERREMSCTTFWLWAHKVTFRLVSNTPIRRARTRNILIVIDNSSSIRCLLKTITFVSVDFLFCCNRLSPVITLKTIFSSKFCCYRLTYVIVRLLQLDMFSLSFLLFWTIPAIGTHTHAYIDEQTFFFVFFTSLAEFLLEQHLSRARLCNDLTGICT